MSVRGALAVLALIASSLAAPAALAQQDRPATPFRINPDAAPPAAGQPPEAVPTDAQPPAAPATGSGSVASAEGVDRPLVPFRRLRLAGESDRRTWSFYLTDEEARREASFMLAYQNSVVVMPEASRLFVTINGTEISTQPIASSSDFSQVDVEVPAGVLVPGPNTIRIEARQFHRIDCSLRGTYELWTDVDSARTGLDFKTQAPRNLRSLDDLVSVGLDAEGRTIVNVIAPSSHERALAPALMQLTQALVLRGRFVNPVFRVVASPEGVRPAGPGVLNMVIGPAPQIQNLVSSLPSDAMTRQAAGFVDDVRLGPSTLVVTGPDWEAVRRVAEAVAESVSRPSGVARQSIATASWAAPDVPNFASARRVTLADMELRTQEFPGRLFRSRFHAGVPADFYAASYGHATLYLDAAYSADVLPGSHVDVYVNGRIASTLTISNRGGGIYRRLPIQIPMTNLRPGVNEVVIEALLETQTDQACLPGSTIPGAARFVLFDTTEISFPDFARAARMPDIAKLGGSGYPYGRATDPVALFLGRHDPEVYSAAATILARLAIDSGRPIPLVHDRPIAGAAESPAIFIGATQHFPPDVMRSLDLAENLATSWRDPEFAVPQAPRTETNALDALIAGYRQGGEGAQDAGQAPPETGGDTQEVFQRWREDLSDGGGWRGSVSAFDDWMQRTFEISFSSLRLGGDAERPYQPPARAGLLVAQQINSGGGGIWTIVTAPSSTSLVAATEQFSNRELWSQASGRVTAFEPQTGRVVQQPPTATKLLLTQPFSLANYRLIAANLLSTNIVLYALILVGACLLLGLYTHRLLARLGRRS